MQCKIKMLPCPYHHQLSNEVLKYRDLCLVSTEHTDGRFQENVTQDKKDMALRTLGL